MLDSMLGFCQVYSIVFEHSCNGLLPPMVLICQPTVHVSVELPISFLLVLMLVMFSRTESLVLMLVLFSRTESLVTAGTGPIHRLLEGFLEDNRWVEPQEGPEIDFYLCQ